MKARILLGYLFGFCWQLHYFIKSNVKIYGFVRHKMCNNHRLPISMREIVKLVNGCELLIEYSITTVTDPCSAWNGLSTPNNSCTKWLSRVFRLSNTALLSSCQSHDNNQIKELTDTSSGNKNICTFVLSLCTTSQNFAKRKTLA